MRLLFYVLLNEGHAKTNDAGKHTYKNTRERERENQNGNLKGTHCPVRLGNSFGFRKQSLLNKFLAIKREVRIDYGKMAAGKRVLRTIITISVKWQENDGNNETCEDWIIRTVAVIW